MQPFHRFNPPEDAAPPERVRFLELNVEPWPDGRRIKVMMTITPFRQPPNLSMVMTDALGEEVSRTSIVENVDFKLVFTMHIRSEQVAGQYTLRAAIFYDEQGVVDERQVVFETREAAGEE